LRPLSLSFFLSFAAGVWRGGVAQRGACDNPQIHHVIFARLTLHTRGAALVPPPLLLLPPPPLLRLLPPPPLLLPPPPLLLLLLLLPLPPLPLPLLQLLMWLAASGSGDQTMPQSLHRRVHCCTRVASHNTATRVVLAVLVEPHALSSLSVELSACQLSASRLSSVTLVIGMQIP
jgi:hypothetical protein